jgi:ferredoxin
MFRLLLAPLGVAASVRRGGRMLAAIVRAGAPIGRACEGRGVCGACRIRPLSGTLSPLTAEEAEALSRAGASPDERLACRARLYSDAEITCAAWGPIH